jgi:hypothetical protein
MKPSQRLFNFWIKWHDNFEEKDCKEFEEIIKAVEELEGNKTEELVIA